MMGYSRLRYAQSRFHVGRAHPNRLIDRTLTPLTKHVKNFATVEIGNGTQFDADLVMGNLGHLEKVLAVACSLQESQGCRLLMSKGSRPSVMAAL
jgi:hypothetical protein